MTPPGPARWPAALGLAALAYGALALRSDAPRMGSALARIAPGSALVALVLVGLSWVLRYAKFHLLLKRLGVQVPVGLGARIFLAGFAMAVTPGKLGEVLKSFLLEDLAGIPAERTAAVVLVERATDLAAFLGLMALAGGVAGITGPVGLGAIAMVLGALLVLSFPGPLLRLLGVRPGEGDPSGLRARLGKALVAGAEISGPGLALGLTVLSIPAWGLEAAALLVLARGMGVGLGPAPATFAYSASTLAGAVSMLPGGLGAAEASLALLLERAQVPSPEAAALTLAIRGMTLWLAVGVGSAVLVRIQGTGRGEGDPQG